MKKLLVLMLVASLCALANGGIMTLQISAGGDPYPPDSMINLLPSQCIMLDVWSPNGYHAGDEEYFGLVLSDATAGNGTIVGGVCRMPPAPNASSMLGDMSEFFPGDGGVFGSIGSYDQLFFASGVYFDEIIFHCENFQDAVIQLWSTVDGATFVLEDTLVIHQPEPATIALLSLGGLLLRKRK